MKNSIRFFVGISLLVLFVFCYSCGVENSEAEMKEAQLAMEKAKSLFAEDLVPSDWKGAMEVWEQGQAAVKEGKPSKTLFLRAKSRFEKIASIAKSTGETLSKEVANMQTANGERFSKLKANIQKGKASSKVQAQLKPIVAEIEAGTTSLDSLMTQGSYLKAKILAKDLSMKIYNAERILQGKKPVV
jgi:hypothetical protein